MTLPPKPHSPRNSLLASGGKKGDLCLLDPRQTMTVRSFPAAHDGNVKSLAIDPEERVLVSGSSDGNIRVSAVYSRKYLSFYKAP